MYKQAYTESLLVSMCSSMQFVHTLIGIIRGHINSWEVAEIQRFECDPHVQNFKQGRSSSVIHMCAKFQVWQIILIPSSMTIKFNDFKMHHFQNFNRMVSNGCMTIKKRGKKGKKYLLHIECRKIVAILFRLLCVSPSKSPNHLHPPSCSFTKIRVSPLQYFSQHLNIVISFIFALFEQNHFEFHVQDT